MSDIKRRSKAEVMAACEGLFSAYVGKARDKVGRLIDHKNPFVSLKACDMVFDRTFGKPGQIINLANQELSEMSDDELRDEAQRLFAEEDEARHGSR